MGRSVLRPYNIVLGAGTERAVLTSHKSLVVSHIAFGHTPSDDADAPSGQRRK